MYKCTVHLSGCQALSFMVGKIYLLTIILNKPQTALLSQNRHMIKIVRSVWG